MRTQRQKIRAAYRLIEAAKRLAPSAPGKNRIDEIEVHCEGYAEPGYGNAQGDDVIATANWNGIDEKWTDNTIERLSGALERLGVEIEWSDEWCACSECSKLVRTSGDSYSWTPSYWLGDGELLCLECVESDPGAYLESLEGNTRAGETLGIDLEANGYVELEGGFEHGLHDGQDANPKSIGKALEAAGVEKYLFRCDDQGQFDTRFSVWIHASELGDDDYPDEPKRTLDEIRQAIAGKTDGPSPSEAAKRFLQGASKALKAHDNERGGT